MRALSMACVLLLAGCGSAEDESENAAANEVVELPHGPMLGAVDLSRPVDLQGAGGSWRMAIAPGRITFADAPGRAPVDFYPVSPRAERTRASYSTKTPDGDPVTITLVAAACGADRLPLTAEVRIGGRTFAGCGQQRGEGEPADEAANVTG